MKKETDKTINKMKGCFLGLAIGDALGAQVEFEPRGVIIKDFGKPGPWNLPYGGWTDDTATAICVAESLIEKDTREQAMERLVRWATEGYNSCTGKPVAIGKATLKSIMGYRITGKVIPPTDEMSSGNGCIMRLAPGVIHNNWRYTLNIGRTMSIEDTITLTHGSKTAISCGLFLGSMLDQAINWWTKPAIGRNCHGIIDTTLPLLNNILESRYLTMKDEELISDTYCVNTLNCAMWAFYTTDNFEDGMIKVISLGGDTDTMGAVYGQLAGAYYGLDGIPDRWINGVMWGDKILELTEKLIEVREDDRRKYEDDIRRSKEKIS